MDGFNLELRRAAPPNPEYVYVPHSDSKPYFDMAHEWVLADHMHQSQFDESFVSHQYIIAAQAHRASICPYGDWGCEGGEQDVVQTITQQRTYGRRQPPVSITRRSATSSTRPVSRGDSTRATHESCGDGGEWSGYQAVRHIYGPDWKKDVSRRMEVHQRRSRWKLANFTWITPVCADSDHVNCGGGFGPSWVAALVNAVGQSQFWN